MTIKQLAPGLTDTQRRELADAEAKLKRLQTETQNGLDWVYEARHLKDSRYRLHDILQTMGEVASVLEKTSAALKRTAKRLGDTLPAEQPE